VFFLDSTINNADRWSRGIGWQWCWIVIDAITGINLIFSQLDGVRLRYLKYKWEIENKVFETSSANNDSHREAVGQRDGIFPFIMRNRFDRSIVAFNDNPSNFIVSRFL
jgi:hypothetical protein